MDAWKNRKITLYTFTNLHDLDIHLTNNHQFSFSQNSQTEKDLNYYDM